MDELLDVGSCRGKHVEKHVVVIDELRVETVNFLVPRKGTPPMQNPDRGLLLYVEVLNRGKFLAVFGCDWVFAPDDSAVGLGFVLDRCLHLVKKSLVHDLQLPDLNVRVLE